MIPLAYSLPAFHPSNWARAEAALLRLQELGFRWVTLHPTWAVDDGPEPRIEPADPAPLAGVVAMARSLGFQIRLEPHLDWRATLTGGPYEWRRRMYLDPSRSYFDHILGPVAELRPDELTLGSELDVSAYEFPERWRDALRQLSGRGILLGHKLNHDWRSARRVIRMEANTERSRRGLGRRWGLGYGRGLRPYLAELDYVAVSFYPPGEWVLDEGYTIGEFGLGSTDVRRPWHFDSTTFRTEEDFALRRGWYLQMLGWLRRRGGPGRAACFWTAGHFDVLGAMEREWGDEHVAEAVQKYHCRS